MNYTTRRALPLILLSLLAVGCGRGTGDASTQNGMMYGYPYGAGYGYPYGGAGTALPGIGEGSGVGSYSSISADELQLLQEELGQSEGQRLVSLLSLLNQDPGNIDTVGRHANEVVQILSRLRGDEILQDLMELAQYLQKELAALRSSPDASRRKAVSRRIGGRFMEFVKRCISRMRSRRR